MRLLYLALCLGFQLTSFAQDCATVNGFSLEKTLEIKKLSNQLLKRNVTIGLKVYVESYQGSNVIDIERIQDYIDFANEKFSGSGIQFDLCDNIITDTQIGILRATLSQEEVLLKLRQDFSADNQIKIFFVKSISGVVENFCSCTAGLPEDFLLIGEGDALQETFTHELGHYFGLNHTHGIELGDDGETDEVVTRAPGNANCETTGDFFCDTQADPGLRPSVSGFSQRFDQSNCQYYCNVTGPNSDKCFDIFGASFTPDVTNMMSYGRGCRNNFSPDQLNLMAGTLNFERSNLINCGSGAVCEDLFYEPSSFEMPYQNLIGETITYEMEKTVEALISNGDDSDAYEIEIHFPQAVSELRLFLSMPSAVNYNLRLWRVINGTKTLVDESQNNGSISDEISFSKVFSNNTYLVEVYSVAGFDCNNPYNLKLELETGGGNVICADDFEFNDLFNTAYVNPETTLEGQRAGEIIACMRPNDVDIYRFKPSGKGALVLENNLGFNIEYFDVNQNLIEEFTLNGSRSIQVLNNSEFFLRVTKPVITSVGYIINLNWTPETGGISDMLNCDDAILTEVGESYCFDNVSDSNNTNYCGNNIQYNGNEKIFTFNHEFNDVITLYLNSNSSLHEVFLLSECNPDVCIPLIKESHWDWYYENGLGGFPSNYLYYTENNIAPGKYYVVIDAHSSSQSCGQFSIVSGPLFLVTTGGCEDFAISNIGPDIEYVYCNQAGIKSYEISIVSENINSYTVSVIGAEIVNQSGNRYTIEKFESVDDFVLQIDFDGCSLTFPINDINCQCTPPNNPILVNGNYHLICGDEEFPILQAINTSGLETDFRWYSSDDLNNPISFNNYYQPNEEGTYYVSLSSVDNQCESGLTPVIVEKEILDVSFFVVQPETNLSENGKILFSSSNFDASELQFIWSDGSTSSSNVKLKEGMYSVRVFGPKGCSNLYTFELEGLLSSTVPSNEFLSVFSIMPNPSEGILKLAFSFEESSDVSFDILDAQGIKVFTIPRKHYHQNVENNIHLNLEKLNSGVYFMKAHMQYHTSTKKILILK